MGKLRAKRVCEALMQLSVRVCGCMTATFSRDDVQGRAMNERQEKMLSFLAPLPWGWRGRGGPRARHAHRGWMPWVPPASHPP